MGKFAKDLIAGMTEALTYAAGKRAGAAVHVVEVPDVRATRTESDGARKE